MLINNLYYRCIKDEVKYLKTNQRIIKKNKSINKEEYIYKWVKNIVPHRPAKNYKWKRKRLKIA